MSTPPNSQSPDRNSGFLQVKNQDFFVLFFQDRKIVIKIFEGDLVGGQSWRGLLGLRFVMVSQG